MTQIYINAKVIDNEAVFRVEYEEYLANLDESLKRLSEAGTVEAC